MGTEVVAQRTPSQPPYSWQEDLSQHVSLAPDGMSIVPNAPQTVPGASSFTQLPGTAEESGVNYMGLLEGSLVQNAERQRPLEKNVHRNQS